MPTTPAGGRRVAASYAAAKATVSEAEAAWLANGAAIAGLAGGRLVPVDGGFRLDHYSVTPGVELNGILGFAGFGPPARFEGLLTVSGTRAAHGYLLIDGASVSGALAGSPVG